MIGRKERKNLNPQPLVYMDKGITTTEEVALILWESTTHAPKKARTDYHRWK